MIRRRTECLGSSIATQRASSSVLRSLGILVLTLTSFGPRRDV